MVLYLGIFTSFKVKLWWEGGEEQNQVYFSTSARCSNDVTMFMHKNIAKSTAVAGK